MPTGSVDVATVQDVLGAVGAEIPSFQLDWFPDVATRLLASLDQRIQGNGLPDNPDASVETHHFIVSAVIDLHRICEGWDDPAGPLSAANGIIDATAVVEHGRLDPEVWGTATSCKINLSLLDGSLTGNVMFDGSLILLPPGPVADQRRERAVSFSVQRPDCRSAIRAPTPRSIFASLTEPWRSGCLSATETSSSSPRRQAPPSPCGPATASSSAT